jgi:hypothetical protein
VEGTLRPGESRLVQQATSDTQTTPPETTRQIPAPPEPAPPEPAERLRIKLATFTVMPSLPLRSLVETVEIMADIQVVFSSSVSADTIAFPVSLALEDTSAEEILREAARQAGLEISIGADSILLQPATE